MVDDVSDRILDERRVALLFMRVDFYSDSNIWDSLRRLGVELEQKGSRWAAHLYGLPEEEDALHYIHIWLHTEPGEEEAGGESRVHWILTLRLMPESEPPPKIASSSEQFGGYPTILNQLTAAIPEKIRKTVDDVQATAAYFLPKEHWERTIAGQSATKKFSHGGMTLQLARETWEVESEQGALTHVAIQCRDDLFIVEGTSKPDIILSAEMMKKAEEKIWAELQILLTPSPG